MCLETSFMDQQHNDLIKMKRKAKSQLLDAIDRGHRLGNFHNYYCFHPPSDRIIPLFHECYPHLPDLILKHRVGDNDNKLNLMTEGEEEGDVSVSYCDLGCNEGVLSLAVARELRKHFDNLNQIRRVRNIRCLGLDVDEELIDRANKKVSSVDASSSSDFSRIETCFKVCDLNDGTAHEDASNLFLRKFYCDTKAIEPPRFDLVSIFSTTMWIHVHGGDSGLTNFLTRVCKMCRLLLIEPQPSKW